MELASTLGNKKNEKYDFEKFVLVPCRLSYCRRAVNLALVWSLSSRG